MRQVEITEDVINDGTDTYIKGDRKSFDDAKAADWIRLGWAKCVATGEHSERKPGAQPIQIDDVVQAHK